ncbi:HU family DNA-binding protein [Pacificibacter marinus]|uniref:Bacterial DNA-binding protein n=1 Tax=Pacificibacter marinus TaxID=658057 RepID=A0A1Y5RUT2_9RHOB|nr:HU family DNA-binding protein [Pacificibacter marinus]SEK41659.1 DNA-binding protein [Pacificibacter marinus]SLN24676.1 Bacterial DNA-binding protein [Pacificibacter marinus]
MVSSKLSASDPKTDTKTAVISTPAEQIEAPDSQMNSVRKKELIERVSDASGVKKGEAKKVIEALLKEMGDILQDGGELNVPPLGKLSVNRQKEISNAFILITKLRRSKGMLADKTPSAEGDGIAASDGAEDDAA